MNNKMTINTYLSTIESKKQTKQTRRDRIMNMDSILMIVTWKGSVGEWMKGSEYKYVQIGSYRIAMGM